MNSLGKKSYKPYGTIFLNGLVQIVGCSKKIGLNTLHQSHALSNIYRSNACFQGRSHQGVSGVTPPNREGDCKIRENFDNFQVIFWQNICLTLCEIVQKKLE